MIKGIVAMSKNFIIGVNGKLPWKLPNDLGFFRDMTMGHFVVMGRKTFESIGKPLPGRETIILTRDTSYQVDGATVINDHKDVISYHCLHGQGRYLWVAGGAEIYKLFAPYIKDWYITVVDVFPAVQGKVTYFPHSIDFVPQKELHHYEVDEHNAYSCTMYKAKARRTQPEVIHER